MQFMDGPALDKARRENSRENFTKSDPFDFRDLRLKPSEYVGFARAEPAPSVTFQKTGREASGFTEQEAEQAHCDAQHSACRNL
jgi:hypothetical protein